MAVYILNAQRFTDSLKYFGKTNSLIKEINNIIDRTRYFMYKDNK